MGLNSFGSMMIDWRRWLKMMIDYDERDEEETIDMVYMYINGNEWLNPLGTCTTIKPKTPKLQCQG